MQRVGFQTLGCKVNFYDTEFLMRTFLDGGYQIVDFKDEADVYVINTCTVTKEGARKSRQIIRQAKRRNPHSIVAVVGCYSQIAPEEVLQIAGVDVIGGTQDRKRLIQLVEEAKQSKLPLNYVEELKEAEEFEESFWRKNASVKQFSGRTRALIKVEDGCNQYCSYCIIPYVRGPVRSRQPEKALNEVKDLVQSGVKEIVLTGIHLGAYGQDLGQRINLVELIKTFLPIPGLQRIRLSSLEITELSDELISLVATEPQLCPHLHLPLQAGSDLILQMMNRPYTVKEFFRRIQKLRDQIPDVAITTDIMVGFPGETADQFQETYDFVQKLGFSQLHVFKYSRRQKTPAAKLKPQLSREVKDQRSEKIRHLGDKLNYRYNQRFLGQTLPVLIEEERDPKTKKLTGITPNYIRVYLNHGSDGLKGQILPVQLTEHWGTKAVLGEI